MSSSNFVQPSETLAELVRLYDGYHLPLLKITATLCPQEAERQVANELRNSLTHIYWGCHRKPENLSRELVKAFDHVLRAVIDEFKMICDAALNLIPPSASAKALANRIRIENVLYGVWDSPAKEQWDTRFSTWIVALDLAIEALDDSFDKIPEDVAVYRRKLGEVPVDAEDADEWLTRLSAITQALRPVIEAENRYRVVVRKRRSDLIVRYLELYEKFIGTLWDPNAEQAYLSLTEEMAAAYRPSVVDRDHQSISALLARGTKEQGATSWSQTGLEMLVQSRRESRTINDSIALTKRAVDEMPPGNTPPKANPIQWPSKESPHSYQSFQRIILESFPEGVTEEVVEKLFTVYVLEWDFEKTTALWKVVFEYAQHRANVDYGASKTSDADFIYELLYSTTQKRVHERLQRSIGENDRTVWLFDIVGSSTTIDAESKKRRLYEQAIITFHRQRGEGKSGPLIVNTWGDAMIAVFDDPMDAMVAVSSLRAFSSSVGAQLRVGAAKGKVRIEVNAVLGIDAFGSVVDLAARLEQSASPGEIVIDQVLGTHLSSTPGFVLQPVTKKLRKDIGRFKAEDPIDCFLLTATEPLRDGQSPSKYNS